MLMKHNISFICKESLESLTKLTIWIYGMYFWMWIIKNKLIIQKLTYLSLLHNILLPNNYVHDWLYLFVCIRSTVINGWILNGKLLYFLNYHH